jgi:MFS family permease
MTTHQSVMNSLFTAFAAFTAFGAAIVAVLAAGGAVQNIAARWSKHAHDEGDPRAWLRNLILVISSTLLICAVVLGSGTGLVLSFLWLHTEGSGGWGWTYGLSEALFWCVVVGVTVVTATAVCAAWLSSALAARPGKGQQAGNTATDRPGHPTAGTRTEGSGSAIMLRVGDDTLKLTGVPPSEARWLTEKWLDRRTAGD